MWPFKKKKIISPSILPLPVEEIKDNNYSHDELEFAAYRADAIARDIEQRRQENLPEREDFNAMFGEALKYFCKLIEAGQKTHEDLKEFEKRLLK